MSPVARRLVAVLGVGLVDPDTAILHGDDLGALRGDGCFEGCRLLTDSAGTTTVAKLDAHLARMRRSAAALGIPFDPAPWQALLADVCAAWTPPGEAGMKLVLTRGRSAAGPPFGYLIVTELPAHYPRQRRDGLRVITLSRGTAIDAFADAPWLLGGVKTLSYAVNMAAQREAERRGADDAIFVSADGVVLESPTSSVVWSIGEELHSTPAEDTGILPGTTQALLFERAADAGWRTAYTRASVEQLHAAEMIWLVGSVRGPVDVVDLDGRMRTRRPDIDARVRALAGF